MVCMRMGLENMVDSIELLRESTKSSSANLMLSRPAAGVISRTEIYDHGLVCYQVCNYVLPGTCFRVEYGVYMTQ